MAICSRARHERTEILPYLAVYGLCLVLATPLRMAYFGLRYCPCLDSVSFLLGLGTVRACLHDIALIVSAGGIMVNLSAAFMDRTMAIAMPSGRMCLQSSNRSVSLTAGSPLRNRDLYSVGASGDQSRVLLIDSVSIQTSNAALLVCREQRKRWLGSCLQCTIHTKNSRPSLETNTYSMNKRYSMY